MPGLTQEQIRQILQTRRRRGVYEQYLIEFLKSNEAGVNVKEEWPDLAVKKASSLKQGFDGLKDKATFKEQLKEAGFPEDAADNVSVIANDEQVFLINVPMVELAPAETTTA
jgi:hypothetical protein